MVASDSFKKDIIIEVRGHKATIHSISARQADGIWYKEDHLLVWLDLDEAVDNTIGFGIDLPVKRYNRDEFLAAVQAAAEESLLILLEKHRYASEEQKRTREKQEALDLVVGEIKSEIGLEQ